MASELAPGEAVDALLALEDEEALEVVLAAAEPRVAARAVVAAPTLERKTDLLWAMEDRQRREVLEAVPPALVGALVQNLEDDNRYLLGDLSLEQFRAVLNLCSPERQYYWVTTALSFTDARANLLPLLLPTRQLVEILMTRAEFGEHLRALADHPLEHERVPPEMLLDPAQALVDLMGAENMLRNFPVKDAGLERLLQTVLDYDPDRYADLVREGLRLADYDENHPLEWKTLTETPVLLEHLEPIRSLVEEETPGEDRPAAPAGPPVALVPVTAAPLARLAAALAAAQRSRVADELQELFVRQAVAEGGSFLLADLQRVARSVEAYLLLGLEGESGGQAERQAAVLAARPLHKIAQSGARLVERLRQPALRLRPLDRIFSPEQRALVRSLAEPRLTVREDGVPMVRLLPGGSLPEAVELGAAAEMLHEAAAWAAAARGLGLERTEQALIRAGSVGALLEELTLAAFLYGRVEPGLAEAGDRERLMRQYAASGGAAAVERLREAALAWNAGVDPRLSVPLLEGTLRRMLEEQAP